MKKKLKVFAGLLFFLAVILLAGTDRQQILAYSVGDHFYSGCNSKALGHTCDCADSNWEVIYVSNTLSCTQGQEYTFAHKCTKHPDANDHICTASAYDVYYSHKAGSSTLNKYANYGWQFGNSTRIYCGQHGNSSIAALGHSASAWSYNESKHWRTCTRCGIQLASGPHVFGYPQLINNNSLYKHTCTVCGYFYTTPVPGYKLYLNPKSRDGLIQGYLNGSDACGPYCNNVTENTLITCNGINLLHGKPNWSTLSYLASKSGSKFLGWEDINGVLVYDANGKWVPDTPYFDSNGNYQKTEDLQLYARYYT